MGEGRPGGAGRRGGRGAGRCIAPLELAGRFVGSRRGALGGCWPSATPAGSAHAWQPLSELPPLPSPLPSCARPPAPAALNSEQKALLDLLVLARSRRFVGFGASSFSFFLREYRALRHGLPKASATLVDARRVGTDTMFAAAAVLAPPDGGSAAAGAPAAAAA